MPHKQQYLFEVVLKSGKNPLKSTYTNPIKQQTCPLSILHHNSKIALKYF